MHPDPESPLAEAARTLITHPWIGDARPGPDGSLRVRPARSALTVRPTGGLVTEYLEHWGEVYDWTYTQANVQHAPDLDLSGWRASDTGRPLPVAHMREWIDHIVDLVLSTGPRWILELGCGTGLLMHRLLDHVDGYVGTDVAAAAVAALRARALPTSAIVHAAAHEATAPAVSAALHEIGAPDGRPDCVLLNSVTQCFPGVDYLRAVLGDAIGLVAPGGSVIVGDVRDSRLLDAYALWVERAVDPSAADAELARRAADRAARDEELLFDPPMLARLAAGIARESGRTVRLSVHPKTMTDDTELTRYRFDAVLRVDADTPPAPKKIAWTSLPGDDRLGTLKTLPSGEPVHVHGIPNAVLAPDHQGAVAPSRLRAAVGPEAAVVADPDDPATLGVVGPAEAAARPVEGIGGGAVHDPFAAFTRRRLQEISRAALRRSPPPHRDIPIVVELPDTGDGAEVRRRAGQRAAEAVTDVDAARLPGFLDRLDEAALLAMACTLRPAGLIRGRATADEMAATLRVAERHRWILRRWLEALTREGWLGRDAEGRLHGLRKVRRDEVIAAGRGMEADGAAIGYPAETTRFLLAAMNRLPELLRDEVPVQGLLFAGDDMGTADGAYRENTVNRYLNAAAGETLRWAAERGAGPLRVLELGAGVGGTTVDALRALTGQDVDYLFSDVSRYFLSLGRELFGDRPGVRFDLFDINADPAGQGVPPGSQDVLLSANVLHNARHVQDVVAGLSGLLAPGGLFVFVETCREMAAILTSMQFLMSPRTGESRLDPGDPRNADDRVFLTRDEWLEVLSGAGLHPLFTLPGDDHPLAATGLHLFVARKG
ncbi:class I SAM-dependent methyltransferase [Nonomuraea sp. K274]|uniref:Class I SAM-dependent methyltransferase n=1 Tax=Nonomuraea cypriaca TaxID=1187855 RepID=A0A931A5U0_9ACTN|nr:class I SAM-dependent methyltransferase [Nonomuraea cypriaca]MBF8186867.1 class I SAM-dependent methyltransferase [Nonomuraea cypriaca]